MQHSQWTGNGKAIALHGARIANHPAALPVVAPCKNGERLILRAFGLPEQSPDHKDPKKDQYRATRSAMIIFGVTRILYRRRGEQLSKAVDPLWYCHPGVAGVYLASLLAQLPTE